MKKTNQITKALLSLTLSSLIGVMAEAYPSAAIVDTLPGLYQGVSDLNGATCEVSITKTLGLVEIQISVNDADQTKLAFDKVTNLRLKREYNATYEFLKENDRSFDPETTQASLVYYKTHGLPSIFGIYPRTDKLDIRWDENQQVYSLGLSVSYSTGNPIDTEPDTRNQSLLCSELKKVN